MAQTPVHKYKGCFLFCAIVLVLSCTSGTDASSWYLNYEQKPYDPCSGRSTRGWCSEGSPSPPPPEPVPPPPSPTLTPEPVPDLSESNDMAIRTRAINKMCFDDPITPEEKAAAEEAEGIITQAFFSCVFGASERCCQSLDGVYGPYEDLISFNCLCFPDYYNYVRERIENAGFDLKEVLEGCEGMGNFETLWNVELCGTANVTAAPEVTYEFSSAVKTQDNP